jgi:NTE family protein
MRAYAVLSGGGVKGAALAGCLAAAEGRGIDWIGCGGTSAGALVSFLSVIGNSGTQIRDIFKRLKPADVLDDGGGSLDELTTLWRRISELGTTKSRIKRLARMYAVGSHPIIETLSSTGGIYSGKKLTGALARQGREAARTSTLFNSANVPSFAALANAGCPMLKVVASNISTGRAVVFSAGDTPAMSVVDAIRASASYPFVYEPVRGVDDHRLVDGGLASNLPCFLFAKEHLATRYPVFAFDLVAAAGRKSQGYGLVEFGRDLLETALEASDSLFVEHITGVHYVQIPIPPNIEAFSRTLDDHQIDALFNAGFTAAGQVLDTFPQLQWAREAGGKLQKQLQTLYGDRKLFLPPLWALAEMMKERTNARDIRAHIMLPTGRQDGSRIVVYGYGFRKTDADGNLELAEHAGCTGRALSTRGPVFADLYDARNNHENWFMTAEQQALVAGDRMSMLSVPIFISTEGPSSEWPIRGILSVDSSTRLEATGWLVGTLGNPALHKTPLDVMTTWADVFAKLLR